MKLIKLSDRAAEQESRTRLARQADLLERMIHECSEQFALEDRALCPVVVPLAVRLRGVRHAGQGVCVGDAGQSICRRSPLPMRLALSRSASGQGSTTGRP